MEILPQILRENVLPGLGDVFADPTLGDFSITDEAAGRFEVDSLIFMYLISVELM